jgi:WD40 repeat protein
LKWSPDGHWLAWQGDFTYELRSWDIVDKKYGPTMRTAYRTGLAGWNADGTVLAAASQDEIGAGVFFWAWPSGALKHAVRGFSQVPFQVEWSPDHQFVAASDGYDKFSIWRADGNPVATCSLPEGSGIWFLAWHPQRPLIAVRYNRRQPAGAFVGLVDGETGEMTKVIPLAESEVGADLPPLWSHDGSQLMLPNHAQSNLATWYDLEGRPQTQSPHSAHRWSAPRPNSDEWLLTYNNGPSVLWNFATQKQRLTLVPHGLVAADWSSDGRWLAAMSSHGELVVWDMERGVVAATQASSQSMISDVHWDQESKRVSAAVEQTRFRPAPGAVTTWTAEGTRESRTEVSPLGIRRIERWNRDRAHWASIPAGGGLQIAALDPQTAAVVSPPKGLVPSDRNLALAVGSPVDDRVLVATWSDLGWELHIVRLGDSSRVPVSVPKGYGVGSLAWSRDGTRFACSFHHGITGNPQVEIWSARKPSVIASVLPGIGGQLSFSPNGRTLLVTAGTTAWLIRADTGTIVGEFAKGHGGAPIADWSPDGQNMVLSTDRGTRGELEVVSTSAVAAMHWLPLPRQCGVAWSPDGQLIAGSNQESLLRVWKITNDKWQPVWTSVPLANEWATFSAGGKLLASSPNAARQLVAVVEKPDGVIATLPFAEFAASRTDAAMEPAP